MKKLCLLVLLLLCIPCLSGAQVTYSGVTIFSIATTGDANPEITVSAACIFDGVTLDQANKAGLLSISSDSSTGSRVTTNRGYNAEIQQAIITIPEQTFTLPRQGISLDQYQSNFMKYIDKRYKIYAEQIMEQYFNTPKHKTTLK